VDSIIHPVSAEYMIETIDRADREGGALVVFTLETPGGLVDSTRAIVTRMLAAKTPVAVFVGPAGLGGLHSHDRGGCTAMARGRTLARRIQSRQQRKAGR
jgi:hypothetical protein